MSFGSEMGEFLTSSNEFKADLIKTVPIGFDNFEFGYIEGFQLRIRLGIAENPGSRNELTLEADGDGAANAFTLKENMTYIIGPGNGLIHATFGLEGEVAYSPKEYWGDLNVKSLSTVAGQTTINARFSIGWETDDGNEMELRCSTLKIST
ncbi:hypothetical protein [Pseudomonas sp. CHM02]|uniref:hypothetical protein n=1 Tax=Pseudomonas sp. CHM02 TaxID=1463662 RepID=UPI000471CF1E|nr:hypothetical protein [Pseudomonas sp. CHM02]